MANFWCPMHIEHTLVNLDNVVSIVKEHSNRITVNTEVSHFSLTFDTNEEREECYANLYQNMFGAN